MLNDESIFYHYCSVDAFVNILKTNSIWLTHARELNDFQEDIFFRKPLQRARQYFKDRSEPEKQLVQQIVDEYYNRVAFPYVACFSKDDDVLSQWRAYANDGKGVAIGFKLGAFSFFDLLAQEHGISAQKALMIDEVSYSHEEREVDFMKNILSACLINYKNCKTESEIVMQGVSALNRLSIFTKSQGFEEEQEVRLAYYPCYRNMLANLSCECSNGSNIGELQFRVRDERIISYFAYNLPENAIASITLGPKCNIDFSQLTLFLNRYAPHVRIDDEIHYSKISYR